MLMLLGALLAAYFMGCGMASEGTVFLWWHPALASGLAAVGAVVFGAALHISDRRRPCRGCVALRVEVASLQQALIADGADKP